MEKLKRNGIWLMVLASFFFSIMGALVKYCVATLSSHEVVFFRTFIMFLFLLPWMLVKKTPLIPTNNKSMFIRSASGFTALVLAFYVTSKISLADASILNGTSVIFVAIFSFFYLKEKISLSLILYILVALVGAGLIVKPSLNIINKPGVLGLLSGVFAAIAYVSIKKLHNTEHYMTMILHFAAFGSLFSFPLMWPHFQMPTPIQWIALVAIGIVATVAQICLTYSYKHAPASVVSPYSFSNFLFCVVWGFLFWNEVPDTYSILGALLIVVCGIGIMKSQNVEGGMVGGEIVEGESRS